MTTTLFVVVAMLFAGAASAQMRMCTGADGNRPDKATTSACQSSVKDEYRNA
jgi:hypothetical protein